ncbi:hypothetical protein A3C95_01425 [Candidatus Kaiserbacteria bacterium RIFCSPHIGHO2_02_FULL_56_30]|uniref:TraD/TraG TraM recognition site domain-containing protein n=1 Tax=Candidatus Kaiserbacteria bacterium RIFCSPHIGHO2_02_FULL_56_30 TaxID=1798499 RepID=A0A1F6E2Y3_9BACT|nr:MAG: hypothetical protein A3C95_01425 [Candidatus Kaiserbacteria bacterium RIFCSPHIGHO2_02_FULL_56_30]
MEKAISSPEEELAYLRARITEKERELARVRPPSPEERATIVSERIIEHKRAPAEAILAPEYRIAAHEIGGEVQKILQGLQLGGYEKAIKQLGETMEARGIKNALSAMERLNDPHLEDDFHRYLVRYVAAGLTVKGIEEKAPRFKALRMTLYEVALPGPTGEDAPHPPRPLKEIVSSMEQLYAGLLSVGEATLGEPSYFTLELAVPANRPDLLFYVAVPNRKRELFEKQLHAIFPHAELHEQPADYNVFAEGGVSVGARISLRGRPALPIKEYAEFDYDPLNTIANAFAKIEHVGEGAALQIVVEPRGDRHVKHYRKILTALKEGIKRDKAFGLPETMFGEMARELGSAFFGPSKPKDEEKRKEVETRQIEANKADVEEVEKKIAAPIIGATIRLIVSSKDAARSHQVLGDISASFNQFANTRGNEFIVKMVEGREAKKLFDAFSFRLPSSEAVPLSLKELTTLYHFPPKGIESSPHLKQARFTSAPAPLSLPKTGVLLGTNSYRGSETKAYLSDEDRLRHLYIVGQTGTGKTGLMKSMIVEDMKAGRGVCFIDPHGNDILDVLSLVPKERYDDVVYFDPADLARPFGLNMLEYDPMHPEQKTFIINELLMIFRRLYGDVPEALGPAFEQYFRNATQLVMEDPSSGSTLLDIPRVLSNAGFRQMKLSRSRNPVVNQFWQEIATKAGGEASLENIVPYITNKFDDFVANDFIRPIIGQQESSFKFREVIDTKKILLINLSKGRLGERNANLLGLIVVGKLFMAALSRADNPRAAHAPFYLYIDEFQNVTTDSIPGILSEARKYRLALTVAHQFLKQIEEKTRDAIFGNVGSLAVFRVGEEDAEFFAKQFAPIFKALDFVNIEFRNCYLKMLAHGVPQKPFNVVTPDVLEGNEAQIEELKQLSAVTFGRDRATVEAMIRERYLS